MNRHIESIKHFLNENKIFFETIVMVALTVAGIFVSCSANKITQRQASIEEALAMPIINIETVYNDDHTQIHGINIFNDGSAVQNFEFEVIPYYFTSVYSRAEGKGYKIDSFILPIEDSIFPVFSVTNNNSKTGLLGSISLSNRTSLYIDDMASFQEFAESHLESELPLAFLSLEYYVKIHYTDILGNYKTEIYNCITGNNFTYSSTGIMFVRDCQISTISVESKQNDVISILYGTDNVIKYVRYGSDSSQVYENFVLTASSAYDSKQLLLD